MWETTQSREPSVVSVRPSLKARPATQSAQLAVLGGYIGNVTVPWMAFPDGPSCPDHFPMLWEDINTGAETPH